jgi:hypothetical protein
VHGPLGLSERRTAGRFAIANVNAVIVAANGGGSMGGGGEGVRG